VGEAGDREELALGAASREDLGFAIFEPRNEPKVLARLAARVPTSVAPAMTAVS
jgi:hypothetical protein